MIPFRLALIGLLAAAPAVAQGQSGILSAEQRHAIEGVMRDYLLKNPDVVQDALTELERRQQEAQKATQAITLREERDHLINSPNDYVIGNPAGDVTLVKFFDYNCPYCRKAKSDVDVLIKGDPQLRVVLKEFPVLGAASTDASRVAVAAKRDLPAGKLREFHAKLMETRGRADGDRALAVAKDFGLDPEKLRKHMQDQAVAAVLRENAALADKLGITGTPAFVLNDGVIAGAVGAEALQRAIANIRACEKLSC
jgi:protein-disulfide isomerase